MSRIIKFRAWDKIEKKMWYPDAIRFDLGEPLNMKLHQGLTWVTFHQHEGLHDPLMQFTGLKDRTGREIFEDDIVRVWFEEPDPDEHFPGKFSDHQVFFGDDYPAFDLKPHISDDCNSLQYAMIEHSVEVIGNIYETPKLWTESDLSHLQKNLQKEQNQ